MGKFVVAPYVPIDSTGKEWCVLELPAEGDPYGEGRVESFHDTEQQAKDALAALDR